MEKSINELVKEHIEQIEEIDIFGTKKAEKAYDKAMNTRHKDLADIHNRLKAALGDPRTLQQVASEIVKDLALQFRLMDR
tara:strand:+ start:91 stop:330 length:240 start_codon:yes stop_codon:yes gene_type:complete